MNTTKLIFRLATLLGIAFTTDLRAQLPNAWQINDNSTSLGVIQYVTNLTAAQVFAATNSGWRYDVVSRMVSDGGSTETHGMAFGDGTRRFYIFLDLNSSGQLTAHLLGGNTNTLTSAAEGTNYHTHEISYDPTTGNATYRFDGGVVATWAGNLSSGQSNQVMWGVNSSGGRGVMNYHQAQFSIAGQGVIADYNAGFDGDPATAPSPATLGWERFTNGATIAETAVSPDSVSLPALVTTLAATAIQPTSAILNASLNPAGLATGCYFEFGVTTSYGNSTATNMILGADFATNVSEVIGGLSSGAAYHFRCVATNTAGIAYGQDLVFATPQLFTVTTLADSGPGSLRQALADANSGDFITFATNGVIRLTGGQLPINKALTITGPGAANLAIDGGGNSGLLDIENGPVTLESLTLTNGNVSGVNNAGGGIVLGPGVMLTINRCVLSGNSATNGAQGGGIANYGTLVINDSTLSGNFAGNGAGIYNNSGGAAVTVTLNNCTLSGNAAAGNGGAIYMYESLYPATVILNNCTLSGNSSGSSIEGGGGIYNYLCILTCNNSTVSGNSALNGGYGGGMISIGTTSFTNTIVAGNAGSQGYPDLYGSITAANSLTGGDPLLAPLGNYGGPTQTMPPRAGSPAIDAGTDSVTGFLLTDQRGLPRLFGSHVDIGAVEFRPFVVVNANDRGPGSLRDMLTNAPDLVTFTNTLAGQAIFLTNGPLSPPQGVTINASSLAGGMTISGNHHSRIVEINPEATVVLDSLTLRDGVAPDGSYPSNSGGGILNLGRLTLDDCQLQNDQATNGSNAGGGGIENYAAMLTASNCAFSGDSAGDGGAVKNDAGTFNLSRSTLADNSATGTGGAIENTGATLAISDSTLSDNATPDNGGGIDNDSGGLVTVSRSTFSGNSAAAGGAVENQDGALLGNNSTFTGNSAATNGGGVDNWYGGLLLLDNCTIYGNSAGDAAGGLNNYGALALTNTIVAGNNAPANANYYFDIAGSFIGSHNLGSGDPRLAPLGNYGGPTQTMPLLFGSPAIDAGDDSVTGFLVTDERGDPRLSSAHVDIGAVEAQISPANNPPQLTGSTFSAAGGNSSFQFTFTNVPDADFTVLAATNLALPLNEWVLIGNAMQNPPGQFHFTDPDATNFPQRFYQVVSP